MSRILKVDRDIAITNSRKIVDARKYIIHGYDSLSADILTVFLPIYFGV